MIKVDDIFDFTDGIFGHGMHAKRIQSLSNATLGVIQTGSLAGQPHEWLICNQHPKTSDQYLLQMLRFHPASFLFSGDTDFCRFGSEHI